MSESLSAAGTFDDDVSDEEFAFWFYEPSAAEVGEDELAPVTTIWMSADEDAEIVHLMLVGTVGGQTSSHRTSSSSTST